MANIVEQINDAMTSRISTVLGATYSELSYVINVEKNNFLGNKKRYGIRPMDSNTVSGLTRNYNMNQLFNVVLTHDYLNLSNNDTDQRDKTFVLYDQMDIIFKDLFLTRAGIPAIILNIEEINIDAPEYVEASSLIILAAQLTIKYRQPL